VNENPSHKFTRKIKNEMPITFVNRQLIDGGDGFDAVLTEAASSGLRSIVESASNTRHFFFSFYIMRNTTRKNNIDAFDQLWGSPDFCWWNRLIRLAMNFF